LETSEPLELEKGVILDIKILNDSVVTVKGEIKNSAGGELIILNGGEVIFHWDLGILRNDGKMTIQPGGRLTNHYEIYNRGAIINEGTIDTTDGHFYSDSAIEGGGGGCSTEVTFGYPSGPSGLGRACFKEKTVT
jgi:hypothetical protein